MSRLNGWKEIASRFGKSVRTVQRWERQLALPVHRLHTAGGEIVYALVEELDEWERRLEVGPPDPAEAALEAAEAREEAEDPAAAAGAGAEAARGGRGLWWALGLAVAVAAASMVVFFPRGGPGLRPGRQPASWTIEDGALAVFGEGGARLWTHRFEFPLPDADYERAADRRDVSFEAVDLDGDGAKEVLFLARAMSGTQSRLWAFDAGGAVRWVSPPVRPVTFGDTTYDPPFGVSRFIVTTGPDGRKAVWLSRIHNTWFPAVVQKLGPDGRVEGEYWQDGHTLFLGVGELGGRPVVLVGGTSNDLLGATLAVLDAANPSGCAPAVHPGYVCRDCPAGGPLKLLVFPKTELNDVLDGQRPWVTRVRPRPGGGWEVQVDVATYWGPEGIRVHGGGLLHAVARLRARGRDLRGRLPARPLAARGRRPAAPSSGPRRLGPAVARAVVGRPALRAPPARRAPSGQRTGSGGRRATSEGVPYTRMGGYENPRTTSAAVEPRTLPNPPNLPRRSVMNNVIDFINTHRDRYLDELKALLAIPSISALPEHKSDVLMLRRVVRQRDAPHRPRERPALRDAGPSRRLRRLAGRARRADHPLLRPLRRAARGPRRAVGVAALRGHRARRRDLRARRRRRQGPGLHALQGHRGPHEAERPPAREHQADPRGRGGGRLRQPRRLRPRPQGRARRRRRRHLRHRHVRARRAVDHLRPARPRVLPDRPARHQERPALGLLRRRRGQPRVRDRADPHADEGPRRPHQDPRLLRRRARRCATRSARRGSACRSTRRSTGRTSPRRSSSASPATPRSSAPGRVPPSRSTASCRASPARAPRPSSPPWRWPR